MRELLVGAVVVVVVDCSRMVVAGVEIVVGMRAVSLGVDVVVMPATVQSRNRSEVSEVAGARWANAT